MKTSIAKLPTLAAAEYPKAIAEAFAQFEDDSGVVESGVIRAANNARHIGILLKEWMGHEQMKFEFFQGWVRENSPKLPKGFDGDKIKKFISIANKLPEPVADFQQAKEALQLTFEAAGMIEVVARTLPQKASPITPLTFFLNAFGSVKEKVEKWIEDEPLDDWPGDRRTTVKEELKWAHDLYERLK